MTVLSNEQIETRLRNWGLRVKHYIEAVGWPPSIFKTIYIYGGTRIDSSFTGGIPNLSFVDDHAEQINDFVSRLFASGGDSKKIAQVLVLEYCVDGDLRSKLAELEFSDRTWRNHKRTGLFYIKGCLSALPRLTA